MKTLWKVQVGDLSVGCSMFIHIATETNRMEDALAAAREETNDAKPATYKNIISIERIGPVKVV